MKLTQFLFALLAAMPLLAQDAAPQAPPDEAATKTQSVVDALSKLKISGYLQAQYVHDERSTNELGRNFDQFSVRRGRVKFAYQAAKTARFVLQPDISTSGVSLTDGYVELTEPWTSWKHTLTAGQFVWPFGFELMQSSSVRETPERSRVIRTLFPGSRDRGVMLSGVGLNRKLSYRVAIVNGTGTTQSSDVNQRKDVVGRVGYSFGPLDLGASAYRGSDLVATTRDATGEEFDKERLGLDFQWKTPLPGLAVRGEYVKGKQAPSGTTSRTGSFDTDGWYVYVVQNAGKRHQLAFRLDEYDPDKDAGGNAIRTFTPSYTFHWDDQSKIMAAYDLIETQGNDPDDDVFTLRYQYSF